MDEIRHFDEYNRQIIGIVLKLTYANPESLPKDLDLSCSSISQTREDVPRDFVQWPTVIGLPHKYSEPRGSNVDCSVRLKLLEHESKFSCIVDGPANVTFDVLEDCYDEATCERMNTQENCPDQTEGNRWSNKKPVIKSQSDFWQRDTTPSAGIIYCHKEEERHNTEKYAVIPFVTSIKKFCPADDENTRQKLYVHAYPTEEILQKGFISLCAAIGDPYLNNATQPYMVYAGDNITISAYSSYYYFASGTRIGLIYRNGTTKHIAPLDSVITTKEKVGIRNFTTKVCVDSTEITDIFSENYRKKSTDVIRKTIRLSVKLPQNITVEYDNIKSNTGLTSWVYTGAPGLTLGCKASGDPPPKIKWHKQGRPISDRIREQHHNESRTVISSVLEFPSLSKNEDILGLHGIYTCKADNRLLDVAEKTFPVTSLNDDLQQVVLNSVNSSGDNIGLILGIVVPLILLLVGGVVGFLVWKIKRQNQELKLLSKAEVDEFIFGKPEFLHHHSSSEEVNNYAPFLPYNKGYEIAREQLEIDQSTVLGSGAYAIVLCGTVHRRGDQTKVAVKTAKPMDDIGYFKALLSELKIMGFIGCHPNIVNLVGAYTKNIQNREIYIAIEFCANGNLLTYLRDNRQRYRNYVDNDGEFVADAVITEDSFVYPGKEGLTTITLMKWAEEIAFGMEFLSNKKVIHGDLAARNILLTEHLVAKIGDFGLSRQLFEYANYIKKQQSPLPWKWLALECLQDMKFSVKSDVWAYSILLYEIFSLGQVPYPGHSYNDEFLEALVIGKRPNKPPSATKDT
ncbi:unnamed protein product [Orchesella dallaii]|uniref:Vascular endothelial growth factor receptor 1 n=1 Tax=Orchesella dallaii TaxID=48710 RepID=A0ABP1Q2S9_9HEXA